MPQHTLWMMLRTLLRSEHDVLVLCLCYNQQMLGVWWTRTDWTAEVVVFAAGSEWEPPGIVQHAMPGCIHGVYAAGGGEIGGLW